MAKIKLKIGANEIEIDSRDFYVDNQTLGETIEKILKHLPENNAQIIYSDQDLNDIGSSIPLSGGLESLDDAETFEPEFSDPKPIEYGEIKSKLRILETSGFLHSPHTVGEIAQQLREYGWAASLLDVSKVLSKMATKKEILKNSQSSRTRYFIEQRIYS